MITPEAQDVIEQHMPVTHGTSGKAMAWWIRDLVPGTQHNVRVQVKNGIGWSKPSYIWWTANTKGEAIFVFPTASVNVMHVLCLCSNGTRDTRASSCVHDVILHSPHDGTAPARLRLPSDRLRDTSP